MGQHGRFAGAGIEVRDRREGLEVRVPITKVDGTELVDSKGRPVYAAQGHQSVYRLPHFSAQTRARSGIKSA